MRWASATQWVLVAIAIAWGIGAVLAASDGLSISEYGLYFVGGIVFAIAALAVFVVSLMRWRRSGRRVQRNLLVALSLQFFVVAATVLAVHLNLGFEVKFAASRDALETVARQVRTGATPQTPTRVGFFTVDEITQVGGSVRFVLGESNMLEKFGVVYSPGGSPPYVSEDSFWHEDGPWWVWVQSW